MRVLLLHNIVNPHMTAVFDRLGAMEGIDLRVAYFAATEGDRKWAEALDTKTSSHILPGKEFNLFTSWDYLSVHYNPGLRHWMREVAWDVLINSGWASPSQWQAFLECRKQRKPHVLWAGSTPLETSWRRSLTRPLVKYMVRNSDAWVSYGTASAQYLKQLGAGEVLPSFHCVDNDRFLTRLEQTRPLRDQLRVQLGITGKRIVLYVGRLIERKGLEALVSAFRTVATRFPDAVLVLAGEGPIRAKLETQAGPSLQKQIHFVGNVKLDDLPAYYGLADAFVLPSLEEVWGLVINEAALASLPLIVTTCCGAAADLLRDGENGYLVMPGSSAALEEALLKLLSDPVRARQMGEESRRLVNRCSPDGVSTVLAQAVRRAAGEAGGGHR